MPLDVDWWSQKRNPIVLRPVNLDEQDAKNDKKLQKNEKFVRAKFPQTTSAGPKCIKMKLNLHFSDS